MSTHNGGQRSRRPLLIELAGPAGVGKSTLAAVLAQRSRAAQGEIWGLPVLSLLGNGISLLPTIVGFWPYSRSLLWNEARHMVRLRTLHRMLHSGSSSCDTTLIFDEGPVFALAWLRGFAHPAMRTALSEAWWQATLSQWAVTVDVVIVLDAPDALLARRIRERSMDHEVKQFADPQIAAWMERFRLALDWVLSELTSRGSVRILRMTTDRNPVELAEHLLESLDRSAHAV